MATISQNLQQVRARINRACSDLGRESDSVALLAVSKTFPASAVREAFHAGLRSFGENYVQEGVEKIAELSDLRAQITWHLIGPLQSNKTRAVAENFDWVQSIDRLKTAERLSEQRPPSLKPLQVCIQVNSSGEASKSGVSPEEVFDLAQAVSRLPHLQLRGIMALPAPTPDPQAQRAALRRVRDVYSLLLGQGLTIDTLSMGMSNDLEAAIVEGSSMLRVGTALFGNR